MTVGVGAIAGVGTGSEEAVIAADRMITFGQQVGIEYEDTESKIGIVDQGPNPCTAVVGAGETTHIDEILNTGSRLHDSNGRAVCSPLPQFNPARVPERPPTDD